MVRIGTFTYIDVKISSLTNASKYLHIPYFTFDVMVRMMLKCSKYLQIGEHISIREHTHVSGTKNFM
jgi:hypothetical protein